MKVVGMVSGIIAPILYMVLILVLGFLETGYNHLTDMMSILGGVEGIRGYAFNIGVMAIGLLVALFAIGIHHALNDGQGSKVGPIMLAIGGVGLFLSGIFHCDAGCANFLARTPIGIMHMIVALIGGMFTALSLFAFFFRTRGTPEWHLLGLFTLLMALLGNGAGILLWIAYGMDIFDEIQGLIQRLGIIFPLLWIFVISIWMMKSLRSS